MVNYFVNKSSFLIFCAVLAQLNCAAKYQQPHYSKRKCVSVCVCCEKKCTHSLCSNKHTFN